jgi:hypothetical protein
VSHSQKALEEKIFTKREYGASGVDIESQIASTFFLSLPFPVVSIRLQSKMTIHRVSRLYKCISAFDILEVSIRLKMVVPGRWLRNRLCLFLRQPDLGCCAMKIIRLDQKPAK